MNETQLQDGQRGYCQCGCGNRTSRIMQTDIKRGRFAAEFSLYKRGHNRRKSIRYIEEWTGFITPCWHWQLAKTHNGYGLAHYPKSGKMVPAHRELYEQRFGPIPEGLQCDHLCRRRDCVNPEHLELVSPAKNVRRGRNTKLTHSDVHAIRASKESQKVLAKRFGVSQGHISRILSGATWRISNKKDATVERIRQSRPEGSRELKPYSLVYVAP